MNAREILIVSNQSGRDYSQIRGELLKALELSEKDVSFLELSHLAEVPRHFSRHAAPHLVLVDWCGEARSKIDAKQLQQTLVGVREADPGACLLLLSDVMPTAADTMHWLDLGAAGLLAPDFRATHLADALRDLLARRFRIQLPRSPRTPTRHKIRIRLASLEQALVAETLNLGIGGMFIRLVPQGVRNGDAVDFEFLMSAEVSEGSSAEISDPNVVKMNAHTISTMGSPSELAAPLLESLRGTGVVVWVRTSAEAGMPEGVGVQFSELTETGRSLIERFVATHRIRAFIPKA